jgi:hypothetical protein
MAGRYYRAPVPTGYDQFGAAIAQGMGAGISAYDRGQRQQEEQRRYEAELERLARMEELAAEARRNQARMLGAAPAGREAVTIPQATGMPAIPIPAAGEIPEGRAPGLTIGQVLGGMNAPAAGAPAPGGMVAMGGQMGPPVQPAPGGAVTIPESLQGGLQFQTEAPAGRLAMEVGGETWYVDPSKSMATQQRRLERSEDAEFRREAEGRARDELRNVIAQVIEGGVTPEESAYMKAAYGISYEDLQDPDKAYEKAWERKKNELLFAHQLDMQKFGARGGAGGLTGNRALDQAVENVGGLAVDLHEQGMSGAEIRRALAEYAPLLGGEGALSNTIRQSIEARNSGISPSAMTTARATMGFDWVGQEGTPEYETALLQAASRVQAQMNKDRIRLYGDGGGNAIESAMDESPAGTRENPFRYQGPSPFNIRPPAGRGVSAGATTPPVTPATAGAPASAKKGGETLSPQARERALDSLTQRVAKGEITEDQAVQLAILEGLIRP